MEQAVKYIRCDGEQHNIPIQIVIYAIDNSI